jgi:hypothetical protein
MTSMSSIVRSNPKEAKMAEPVTPSQILDRLQDIASHARGLEMAIGGAVSICSEERAALDRIAGGLFGAIRHLYGELDEQHKAQGGEQ